jgi:serine phosphatase RsbU (regulator of sigma subunit)
VVCEYNRSKRHVRFAAAMRPVIIVMDGELYYIKGNKHSVGGESSAGKFFDDQEYYLREGDMIYLFTDGIADQFGGPFGKKLLIPKLRAFIEENHKLPLAEQKVELSKLFYGWKKDEDQVDDVLFMGLRV